MSNLDENLKHVAVIGAAGKMGSGISLILLQEIALLEALKTGKVGSGDYTITLIDSNPQGLSALRKYLRTQLTKYAEKNINSLRKYFADNNSLVSNEDIIRAFVEGAMDSVRIDTDPINAKDAFLVFEAIVENIEAKEMLFKLLKSNSRQKQFYFTNTSSIPISLLNQNCQLENRLIGYHFYNPPAVQKLLEVVFPKNINSDLERIALELAKRLQKHVVKANDIAGFIGNGFLIPEVIFACSQARGLSVNRPSPLHEAIYLIDKVTHDFLLRPMGIFQLIDYVGIDVCHNIAKIMKTYLPDPSLHDEILDQMIAKGITGGQNSDGSQKNGFFQYQHHTVTGVYNLGENRYLPILDNSEIILGIIPDTISWKTLQKEKDKEKRVKQHFEILFSEDTLGSSLALDFLLHSQKIVQDLVTRGIANSLDDVDTVLEKGFFHQYRLRNIEIRSQEPGVRSQNGIQKFRIQNK